MREKKVKAETKLEPRQKVTLKSTEEKIDIESRATVKMFRKVPLTRLHARDEDGYLISNDLADYMLVECRICQALKPKTRLREHTKSAHGISITEYKARFGELEPIEPVFHRCGICEKKIFLDNDAVAVHLKSLGHPRITHKDYNEAFMVDTRSSTRQCTTFLGVNEVAQSNSAKPGLEDQETPLSEGNRLGEVIRGRSAVELKGCSSNMISHFELVEDESKESGDFEGDFVFEDMRDSDSLASVEIELVGSEDVTQSRSSFETDKKRNYMDTSKCEDDDSLASVEIELVGSEDEPGSKSWSETDKKRDDKDTSTCEDGDSLASVEIGCEDAPVGKSSSETDPRRNSDSDSLASVEIEMESSTHSSEVGSPSKTRKRSHSIETLKNDISESLSKIKVVMDSFETSKIRRRFQVGERVLYFEPHFYNMYEGYIVSRSKKKGFFLVKGLNTNKTVEIPSDQLRKDEPENWEEMKKVNEFKEEENEGDSFSVGEEVLCYEPDLKNVNKIYEAKIIRILQVAGENEASYLVHFPGWGNKYNKRVDRSLLLKDTPGNRERMKQTNLMMDQRLSKKLKIVKGTPATKKNTYVEHAQG